MGTKVNMGQQGALVAEVTVGTHCHHVEGSDPSLHSALVRPQLQCSAQIWAPHNKSDLDMLEESAGKGHRCVWERGKAQRSGAVQLWRLRGISSLYGNNCREGGRKMEPSGAQWWDHRHWCSLEHRRCPLNIRKPFCIVRMTKRWHRLPRDMESLSLEIFQSHLDVVLGNWSSVVLLGQRDWST